MSEAPRIILGGIWGRMGQALAPALLADPRVRLVGGLYAPHQEEESPPLRAALEAAGVVLDASPVALMNLLEGADVLLDFSTREGVRSNLEAALAKGVDALIGVTGFDAEEQRWLAGLSAQSGRRIWWVPNFCLGMALMNRFAQLARKVYGAVEITELHHDRKLDAPSGSALHTAQLIAAAGATGPVYAPPVVAESSPSVSSAQFAAPRGMRVEGIPVHSVRLPGLLAHEQVQFGGTGEGLTLRHDTYDRSAFVEGVIRAVCHLPRLTGYQKGLEGVLDELL